MYLANLDLIHLGQTDYVRLSDSGKYILAIHNLVSRSRLAKLPKQQLIYLNLSPDDLEIVARWLDSIQVRHQIPQGQIQQLL